MPLYEYECQQCRRHTEKRQKFSDPEITECPHCGGPLQRVISAPNIAFKGGGWYKDLYSSTRPPASAEGKSDGGSGAQGDGGSADAGGSKEGAPQPSPTPSAPSGDSAKAAPPSTAAPSAASTPAPSSTPSPAKG